MARCAIVENGKVRNIVEAAVEFAQARGWIVTDDAKIGDNYDGSTFTTPPKSPDEIAEEARERSRREDAQAIREQRQAEAILRGRPNQIDSYIDGNVTDLESAKEVIKVLAKAIAVIGYDTLR